METLGVQQAEVARALGVSQGTISRWLTGDREITPVRAAQIGSLLDQAENDTGGRWPPEPQDLFEADWHLRWAPLRRLAGRVDPLIGELLHVAADLPRDRHLELVEQARRMREIDTGTRERRMVSPVPGPMVNLDDHALAAESGEDPSHVDAAGAQRPSPPPADDDHRI